MMDNSTIIEGTVKFRDGKKVDYFIIIIVLVKSFAIRVLLIKCYNVAFYLTKCKARHSASLAQPCSPGFA